MTQGEVLLPGGALQLTAPVVVLVTTVPQTRVATAKLQAA